MSTPSSSTPTLLASFRTCYGELLRYLVHRCGDADAARDIAHDTWVRAFELSDRGQGPALRDDGEARAYLFTMARNLLIDQQRRDGVARRLASETSMASGAGVLSIAPDAADAAMYGQAIDAIERALAALPERARQVFTRHRVDGVDQQTLASAFGISRNMVERDMMLAMDRVQHALEQWRCGDDARPASSPSVSEGDGGGPNSDVARRRGRRRSLGSLLGLAATTLAGLGGWRWWRLAVPQWQVAVATGRARSARQSLPDGGAVTLDAMSRIELAYYAGWRHARLLTGAAFFDVAADASRPFIVDVPIAAAPVAGETGSPAGAGDSTPGDGTALRITVLGTRFGVERLDDAGVQVQVESGLVRVRVPGQGAAPARDHELSAGQSLRWLAADPSASAGSTVSVTRMATPRQAADWRHGVIAFDDARLDDVVHRLERYLTRPVEVEPSAAGLRVSGQVRIALTEDFVRALPGVVPVRSRIVDGRWRISAR
ncbi:MAG: sigma-70 family RNA polymerase sigma factor [Burkholderiaceae bacterium]